MSGTGYADITGETDWVREMILEYDDVARENSAWIVHLCGHDSVPWDLCTLMLSKKLKENDDELKEVKFFDDISSSPSGGTLETMVGIMSGKDTSEKKKTAYDPLLRDQKGEKSTSSLKAENVFPLERADRFNFAARGFFVMAGVNANTVKRSNALLNYGSHVTYSEGLGFPSYTAAVSNIVGLAAFGLGLAFPPTRYLLRKTVLPAPGEGPSQEDMLKGYLKISGDATGVKGTKVACKMSFDVDPGYMDTARMVVESALCLSLDKDKISVPGGSYTPASCQGTVLLDRLTKTGTSFEFL